jgi:hypothetical protein
MSISANLSGEPAAAQREVYERMLELAELTVYKQMQRGSNRQLADTQIKQPAAPPSTSQ